MSVTFTAQAAPEDMDVNMSNRNAAFVADALGISLDPDWCGSMPATDFQGRVLTALALAPKDEGMPSYEVPGPGARMIEGARHPGDLQDRLRQLHTLAQWAVAHGAEVWWS
jgi:hypothetical protein